jgi:hypothetical protein
MAVYKISDNFLIICNPETFIINVSMRSIDAKQNYICIIPLPQGIKMFLTEGTKMLNKKL